MIAVPFKPEHLASLRIQRAQVMELPSITPQIAAVISQHEAWTCIDGNEPLLCGGVVPYQGGGVLWAAVSGNVGTRMITLTRMAKRYLTLNQLPMETGVRVGFAAGCRWAELLGFRRDGFDGSDHYRYVRP